MPLPLSRSPGRFLTGSIKNPEQTMTMAFGYFARLSNRFPAIETTDMPSTNSEKRLMVDPLENWHG